MEKYCIQVADRIIKFRNVAPKPPCGGVTLPETSACLLASERAERARAPQWRSSKRTHRRRRPTYSGVGGIDAGFHEIRVCAVVAPPPLKSTVIRTRWCCWDPSWDRGCVLMIWEFPKPLSLGELAGFLREPCRPPGVQTCCTQARRLTRENRNPSILGTLNHHITSRGRVLLG